MYGGKWSGRYSGKWFGDAQEAAQAGVRGLLAFWAGGAGAATSALVNGGFKGLLAFWAGGAATALESLALPVDEFGSGRAHQHDHEFDDELFEIAAMLIASGALEQLMKEP